MIKPVLLKEIRDEKNNILEAVKAPKIIRNIISENTAAKIKSYMIESFEKGSAGNARVKGITIAGKTGVSQLYNYNMQSGIAYNSANYIYSLFGFFPAENPEYAIYIIVNDPAKTGGKNISAELFKRIVENLRKKCKM